jgi:hypothetical protein
MKMSKKLISADAKAESLEQVKQRFAQWRATRVRGQRIPRSLWEAAVELAMQGEAKQVAYELRIDYGQLKRRLEGGGALAACPAGEAARFVELFTPGAIGGGECVIEMQNVRGAKVRIQIKSGDLPGCVAGVSRSFWSAP